MIKKIFLKKHNLFFLLLIFIILGSYWTYLSKLANFNIPKGQNLKENISKLAKNIRIEGKIVGDVYLIGREINIDGDISGNLIVLAQNINVSSNSHISNNIILIGNKVTLNGQVGGSVYSLVNRFESFSLFTVKGSLYLGSQVSKISGTINSSLFGQSAQTMNIDATIIGSSKLMSNNLIVDNNAKLSYLQYQSLNSLVVKDDKSILSKEKIKNNNSVVLNILRLGVSRILFYLLILLIILSILPNPEKILMLKKSLSINFSYFVTGLFFLILIPVMIIVSKFYPQLLIFLATIFLFLKIIYFPFVVLIVANIIKNKIKWLKNKYLKFLIIFSFMIFLDILLGKFGNIYLAYRMIIFTWVLGFTINNSMTGFKKLNKSIEN